MKIFTPIGNKQSLSRKVATEIEAAIVSRKIISGSRLPSELELCAQFGVSRTAVREALQTLSAKGIISIEKGRGIFVNGFSSDTVTKPMQSYLEFKSETIDVLDVIKARLIIEPSFAEYAALHRDEEDIEILKKDMDDMIRNAGHEKEHANLDMAFHLHIAAASKNHIMPLILQPIHRLMPNIKQRILSTVPDAFESAIIWHQKIVDAVKDSDPVRAYDMMKEHLEIAMEHAQLMLKAEREKQI